MTDHPSILEQIDAVEQAEVLAWTWARLAHVHAVNIIELCRRLEAAAETLRTLEFGAVIAR